MKVIHLISGGDSGGAKTHVLSLLQHLNQTITAQLVCFRDGPFVDSELGKIPQGWNVGNYTDIVEIKSGGTPKIGIPEYWNGKIPFCSPKDVGVSCFVLDTEKHITAKGLKNCNSSLF